MEVIDLGEGASDAEGKNSDAQRKRDSGYSYKRPESFALGSRGRLEFRQSANKGRIVNRHSAQTNRPVNKYGPPGYSSPIRSVSHNQQHHGHFNQQQSNNFDGRPGGLRVQQVPSPIREADFVESNPISTQNNQPFATNSANYLPPQNQKLPGYAATQTFSAVRAAENHHQAQGIVESQGQLSDAALFLSENAHAIQQLYGAPPDDRDFAPHPDQFLGHTNQLRNPNGQFDNFQATLQGSESFSGPLPSYASGTFGGEETLEQIQSLEKDRLIVQLQRALATQAQAESADATGRYAENQPSFVQNQDLLASLGQRTKIHGLNTPQSSVNFGPGNTAFNQSPFLPGTTISPGFPGFSYGLSTTTRPSTSTTATTTSTTTTVQPPQAAKGDGSLLVGSSVPTGVPVYGGFVPTLIAGTSFVSGVPSYGTSLFAPATVTPAQPSGSSPTHFGLPIPSRPDQKIPTPGATPSTPTSSATPTVPLSPPVNGVPIPLYPVATPLHPVLTSLHPASPSHVHPVQTPTYGVQTPAISSVLYKPIKPVYPFYYYPNVAYHLSHKPTLPTLPTYPWNYAPTYAQVKPTQIWK